MKITGLDIRFCRADGLHDRNDGIRHIKALPYLSVVQALEGSYEVSIDGGECHHVEAGGAFIAPSSVIQAITHTTDADSGYMTAQWVFLDVLVNGCYRLDEVFSFPEVLPKQYEQEIEQLITQMRQADGLCLSLSLAYRILHILLQIGAPRKAEEPLIERLTAYIREHYREKISYERFAQELHISKSGLFRLFGSRFGKPPSRYINEYRISIATALLESTERSVKDIAYSVGFPDEFYFSKLFKKINGMAPSAYRARNQREHR